MANYGYDYTGIQKFNAYGIDGVLKSVGYDVNGDVVYRRNPINLKVMEYNIGQWYIGNSNPVPASLEQEYLALQTGIIERADADILCLPEYHTLFSDSGTTSESILSQYYSYVNGYRPGLYSGRCICSKYPVSNYVRHTYQSQNGRGNYYDSCTVTVDGVAFTLIITHLEASDMTVKAEQATELFNFTRTLTGLILICGDFNSNLYDPMSEGNLNIYGNFLNVGYTIANDGAFGILNTACNSSDWSEAFAIDNMIASEGFTFTAVTTDLAKTTDDIAAKIDHVPLIADIQIA